MRVLFSKTQILVKIYTDITIKIKYMKKLETRAIKEKQIKSPENEQAEMIKKLMEELEKQKMENEKLKKEILVSRKNGVSGLRNRGAIYQVFESDVKEKAAEFVQDIELLENDELKERVAKWDLKTIKDQKLSVALGDLAYLKLVNDTIGHDAGDEFLKTIGDVAREEMGSPEIEISEEQLKETRFVAGRTGGDEFLTIIHENAENADKISKEFGLKISNSKFQILEKMDLKPHMDIGVAHLSEGMEAFKELVLAGAKIPSADRLRKIENLTVRIADYRQFINKLKNKLLVLIEKRMKRPEIYANLKERSAGIKDEDIDYLLSVKNGGFEKILEEFTEKKAEQNTEELTKENKEQIDLKRKIVRKIAMRKE